MFGGPTKTSSRSAIAAALGMTLGGFAMMGATLPRPRISGVTAARISKSG